MSAAGEAPTVVVQRGLWFEELQVGTIYQHAPGRTVSEADNTYFSVMTMNPQALHLDAVFGAGSEFGERLVNSLFTMSVLVGLSVGHLTQGTLIANLAFSHVSFPEPVFIGDTLFGRTEIIGKRLSASRPGQGVVTFRHTGTNQKGEVVAVIERTSLMACRGETA